MHFLKKITLFSVLSSTCFSIDISIASQAQRAFLSEVSETSGPHCNCSGVEPYARKGAPPGPYICRNQHLGPVNLPDKFPLLSFVNNYNRFGKLTPAEFLAKYIDANHYWKYPEKDGWLLDVNGQPINGRFILKAGQLVDRFGDETGKYFGAADAPYDQRSIPPQSLIPNSNDTSVPHNYYLYKVIKDFEVVSGPIAPWFEQPGMGTQFYVGGPGPIKVTIKDLREKGYLELLDTNKVEAGPGIVSCGKQDLQVCPRKFTCTAPS